MSSHEDTAPDAGMEGAVMQRYAKAAAVRQEALCCPTRHDAGYLEALPSEILERDYGCGNPSVFARDGDTVLDLGSGTCKLAYILSQVVGPTREPCGRRRKDCAGRVRSSLMLRWISWSPAAF